MRILSILVTTMTRLERLKPAFAVLLGVALGIQVWFEASLSLREPMTFQHVFRLMLIALLASTLVTYGRPARLLAALRIWIAADVAFSLGDRFGVFGPYHTFGVSFGNWSNFVYYTGVLNWYCPHALIPFLAIVATILETAIVVLFVTDVAPRPVSLLAAVLFMVYTTTITVTGGFASQLDFAVSLLVSGCLFMASTRERSGPILQAP